MTARPATLVLAGSLALAPALLAQEHAVPRGGGGGGSSGERSHPSPSSGVSSSSGGSSSSSSGGYVGSSGSSGLSTSERRHPRAGTGRGSAGGGGYYPGYPGWGGGAYYPGYWGAWWPYGSYGWYGSYYGYPWGWGGGSGTVYHYVQREGGSLRVLVNPSEARVYVDGYYAGTVDDFDGLFQRLRVSPGRHEITLRLEGHKTHRMRVYVAPGSTLKLHHDMERGQGESFEDLGSDEPVPEREARREREQEDRWAGEEARAEDEEQAALGGRLELRVRPEDASVYVDGAFRGTAREAASLRLAPGRHRVEIVRPGYRTVEREVEVAPGETSRLAIELERPEA
jgi:hypothetical protein